MVELGYLIDDALTSSAPRGSKEEERDTLPLKELLSYRLPCAIQRGEVILRQVVYEACILLCFDEGPAAIGEIRGVKCLRLTALLVEVLRRTNKRLLELFLLLDYSTT